MNVTPVLIVLTGPSGVGKDAVLSRMRDIHKNYHYIVTATTRPQRSNEQNGTDYVFVTEETFQGMVSKDELLEWAQVYGNFYGVPKSQVLDAINQGNDVIIKTDVQGAATIKTLMPYSICIFLAPPNIDELARRLQQRMTDSLKALKLRLDTAESEMQTAHNFDHVVVNYHNRLDDTVEEIDRIIMKERYRTTARNVSS